MVCATLLRAVVVMVTFCQAAAWYYTNPSKFLIVSNAANGSIFYAKIPPRGPIEGLKELIKAGDGLTHPQGLAVDQKRKLLIVADSGLKKVVSYKFGLDHKDQLFVGDQVSVADNVESRWVAVDGVGNVYFTNELLNQVMMVPSQDVESGTTREGTVVFDQKNVSAVSAPGGIATDNFYLYWTNKMDGLLQGSVVRSLKDRRPGEKLPMETAPLAKKYPKAYGICVVANQVFYTEHDTTLMAMPKAGGEPVVISDELKSPRGCAWDGENQLYIADRLSKAVYAVPAPMISLERAQLVKVLDLEEAFGLAVFSSACRFTWRAAAPLHVALLFLAVYFSSSV